MIKAPNVGPAEVSPEDDACDAASARLLPSARPVSKAARLREMLQSSTLEFLMEAHNGISARIVQEAGFRGVWASGLTLSAQFGVRDNNEVSWTQVVDMVDLVGPRPLYRHV